VSAIEATVKEPIGLPVVPEELHVGGALVVEEEGLAGARISAERISHQAGETIEGEVEADGLRGDVDLSREPHGSGLPAQTLERDREAVDHQRRGSRHLEPNARLGLEDPPSLTRR
jgi:hypothetical protein